MKSASKCTLKISAIVVYRYDMYTKVVRVRRMRNLTKLIVQYVALNISLPRVEIFQSVIALSFIVI